MTTALLTDDHDAARLDGAEARARGDGLSSCPLYRANALPESTGEPIVAWARRVWAWENGWRTENLQHHTN